MNSVNIPGSDMKLYDGTVVILARFPGTKWVVHEGWYTYNGRQYSGWYFCSIPAQTVLPINSQDLSMLTIISGKSTDVDPEVPAPPPIPAPYPPIYPPGPAPGPGPHPPYPPYPPIPPTPPQPPTPPSPTPDEPAYFSVKSKAQLDAAFISVPTLRHRDALFESTDMIPDGKIVRVNSVGGTTIYYIWDKYDDEWKTLNLEIDIDTLLSKYYTSEQVDSLLSAMNANIDTVSSNVEELSSSVDEKFTELSENVDEMQVHIDDIETAIAEIGGPMHFIGISTFPITDGGREIPIIDGEQHIELHKGDVVVYGKEEFVWSGSYWYELGDSPSDIQEQLDALREKDSELDATDVELQRQITDIQEIIGGSGYSIWDVEDGIEGNTDSGEDPDTQG